MLKAVKAKKILKHLGFCSTEKNNDIVFDKSHIGGMAFNVKGMEKKIIISSSINITRSTVAVAKLVVEKNLNIGKCKDVVEFDKMIRNW
jgi:hypothetical protein